MEVVPFVYILASFMERRVCAVQSIYIRPHEVLNLHALNLMVVQRVLKAAYQPYIIQQPA